ncbi:SURF1 family protein [Ancylobacter sp. 6x-1]|uniref:SURF1-like protein n=1 Tax=Ancylobacter crimeensis TaxID=2579147 RepID=A0ABT0D7F0_9HYPH|nr:SURF1 family protein [Ancylobacter crimeensis]MCK0195859.1 SURF1 family protein [Ancylobacter crimeensis]
MRPADQPDGVNLDAAAAPRSPRFRIVLALVATCLVAVLLALGSWQVIRRAWKLDLIARVEARVNGEARPFPGPADWPEVSAARDEYRRSTAAGHFLNDRETLVQAVTDLGGGFWVVTPFVTDEGFTVLVNRGFVPADRRNADARAEGLPAGAVRITGLLRLTEPGGGFLRSNDPAADRWYSRDVTAIATARGLQSVAPYFIDADATPNPGGWPRGGLTVIHFPNNHLVYALTWFALAGMVAAGAFYALRRP